MRDNLLSEWIAPSLIISVAYALAFATTFAVVMPVQNSVLPAFGNYASLLFLPHGVRVIGAWMYGWRSLLFLAPGAVLTHSYLYGSGGFSLDYMVAVFFGVFCAALSFWFLHCWEWISAWTNRIASIGATSCWQVARLRF